VCSVVSALDPALVTLAHCGDAAYRDAFELLHRHEADHSNGIWQADHTQLDLILAGGDRPWLSAILDDRSRGVAGFSVSLTAPSALQTSLALRQSIWRKPEPGWGLCGIPDVLYVDHGSDFTSRHLEQVAADLHIQLIHSTVGRPQGRGKIERFFRTVNQLFLATLSGYAPRGDP
jgi:putative transposase